MRSLLLSFLAIIGVFAGSATAAPPPAPPTLDGGVYQVHVVIEAGGRVIASPTVTLLAGSEVVTAYSGLADGPMPGYALRLTLDQVSGSPNGAMQIHSEIYAPQGGQWVSMGTPGVRSAVGGTARFQSAERTPYGDGGWSISYTVTKTDLVRSASDVGSLSDCPMYQQLGATPLPGVRVFGPSKR